MKYLIAIIGLLASCFSSHAQLPNWQSLKLDVEWEPHVLYNDTVDHALYIAGRFHTVNGQIANVIRWDGNSYTLLPPSPHYIIGDLIRYKGMLYACGSEYITRYNGSS